MTENGTLVDLTRNPSNQSTRALYAKSYNMLDKAQEILQTDKHRVCMCHQYRLPQADEIAITRNLDEQRAAYGGLMKCGDVWACPVCSRKISEERRIELQTAVEAAKSRGMRVLMLTLTHSHKIADKLATSRAMMQRAWSRLTSGRWWQEMREAYGIVGHVRAQELTYGENGWHVHFHALIFCECPDIDEQAMETFFRSKWAQILHSIGGYASFERGAWLSSHENKVAEYVSKFGHMPEFMDAGEMSKLPDTWNESHEIAKQVSKIAKTETGRTPFQLLHDATQGDQQASALYREYVLAMKNARQLVWSNGLKELLLGGGDKTDQEIAEMVEVETVATVDIKTFRSLVRCGARGYVLDLAANGQDAELHTLLEYFRQRAWCNEGIIRQEE